MKAFLVKRILLLVPVALGAMTVVFSLIHFIPGDPVEAMLGDGALPKDIEEMRTRLRLDDPLTVQYGRYLAGLVRGDLGTSFRTQQPVLEEIGRRLPNTFLLAVFSIFVSSLIASSNRLAASFDSPSSNIVSAKRVSEAEVLRNWQSSSNTLRAAR